jgi:hypothetical protein
MGEEKEGEWQYSHSMRIQSGTRITVKTIFTHKKKKTKTNSYGGIHTEDKLKKRRAVVTFLISGSHGVEYEDDCLLGCFAV